MGIRVNGVDKMLVKEKLHLKLDEAHPEDREYLVRQKHQGLLRRNKKIEFLKCELETSIREVQNLQSLLSEVHERISDAYYELDSEWRFVNVNLKFCEFVKKERDELIGQLCREYLPNVITKELFSQFMKALTLQQPVQFEAFCESTGKTLLFKAYPQNERLHVYLSDLTEQRKAEMGLSESKAKNNLILESITDAFFAVDHDWKLINMNHVAEGIYQFDRKTVLNRGFWEVLSKSVGSEFYAKCIKAMTELTPQSLEAYSLYRTNLILEANIFPCQEGLYIFFRDVTEKRRIDKELLRLNNLHLIGELSAGISHEIRNPMTTVRGFLQIMGHKQEYAKDYEFFNLMITELDRANSIISEFLSLAKDKPVKLQYADLNEKIEAIFPLLLADALKSEMNIKMNLDCIPQILIDENEVRQLVLNLVRNGFEAMSPGGTLTISTHAKDDYIYFEVLDEGSGIPPEIIEKLGTPFYSTKDYGTGLGLAICYSIVNRHQASLDIKSSSQGTKVTVKFKKAI
ncbi:MAG: domain S-box [Firmicutes bacterium]|nr:domain S-box [Bacillota bacterium]